LSVTLLQGDSSGYGDGPLITVSFSEACDIATAILYGDTSYAAMASVVNQGIQDVELGQPEGAHIEIEITGWTNPITGTDYSGQIADYINSNWQNGNVISPETGNPIQPWTDYPNQIAWGGNDTVTLRWVKGMPLILIVIFWLLLAAAVYYIINWLGVSKNQSWILSSKNPQCSTGYYWNGSACVQQPDIGTPQCSSGYYWDGTTCAKKPSWWSNLSFIDKLALIIGGSFIAMFGIVYVSERSIAEAGAAKVVVER
jgi:hypothetical protein